MESPRFGAGLLRGFAYVAAMIHIAAQLIHRTLATATNTETFVIITRPNAVVSGAFARFHSAKSTRAD